MNYYQMITFWSDKVTRKEPNRPPTDVSKKRDSNVVVLFLWEGG